MSDKKNEEELNGTEVLESRSDEVVTILVKSSAEIEQDMYADTKKLAKDAIDGDRAVSKPLIEVLYSPVFKDASMPRLAPVYEDLPSLTEDVGYKPAWKIIQDMIQQGKIAAAEEGDYEFEDAESALSAPETYEPEMDSDFSDDFRAVQQQQEEVNRLRKSASQQQQEETQEISPGDKSDDDKKTTEQKNKQKEE